MDTQKKLAMLEDVMDLDEGTLNAETELSEMDCWDSMTKLSLIVMMDDEFSKTLSGEQIRSFKTVQDILNFME